MSGKINSKTTKNEYLIQPYNTIILNNIYLKCIYYCIHH